MAQSTESKRIVIAGAGYAGLHIAQRLGAKIGPQDDTRITLIDRHDFHQLLTELPRVAAGTRSQEEVRVPLQSVLPPVVEFIQTALTGLDLEARRVQAESDTFPYSRLVLALGSRPNDFAIPGLAERVIFMWSAADAVRVHRSIDENVKLAAAAVDREEQQRLLTVVIGGGGATGVELAGAFAEELPVMARRHSASTAACTVVLIEAGQTILAGSSQELISRATSILAQLDVQVLTNSVIVEAVPTGFRLKNGRLITGGTFVWAGGVKAPDLVKGCGLEIGYNGRIKVDRYLRALERPEIYVAGDLASVPDPETGMVLPPLAQTAIAEGDSVAENLWNEIRKREPTPFHPRDKGLVVSVGGTRGVAQIAGLTLGGRLAHTLKDAIEWEYRNSVKHLRGWSA